MKLAIRCGTHLNGYTSDNICQGNELTPQNVLKLHEIMKMNGMYASCLFSRENLEDLSNELKSLGKIVKP